MVKTTLKNKVNAKLKKNKKQNKSPSSLSELAKELGFSRQIFYTKDCTPNAISKLKEWVEKNG